jgi:threonine synthase
VAATQAVLEEVDRGKVYASHAYMPFGSNGLATIAYEIWEAAGEIGTVIAPVGHGGLLLGIVRGFKGLLKRGLITSEPYYVGVQPKACSPLVVAYKDGLTVLENYKDAKTVAEGTQIRQPVQGEVLLKELSASRGEFVDVEEEKIMPAHQELARRGIFVEPTSAMVWAALDKHMGRMRQPVVLVMTGSGLKYTG